MIPIFRPRPALLLPLTLTLFVLAAGCASTGAVPQPFPTPAGSARTTPARPGASSPASPDPAAPNPAAPAPFADGYAIAGTALGLRGTPYRSGGRDPSGFDCSGLVWYVFKQHGIGVGRTVSEQFHEGLEVQSASLEPGDLVFFATESRGASHVGLSIGGDEFVHAPNSRGEVRVERLSAPYWSGRYLGARRIR